jgi:hypothetical protein
MNWLESHGIGLLYDQPAGYPDDILVQYNNIAINRIEMFHDWLSDFEPTDHTVALWMPKGLKQRKNISNE